MARSANNDATAQVVRKVRKLVTKPNLFFYDFFRKRMESSDRGVLRSASAKRKRDFITDQTALYERLVDHLSQRATAVQEIPTQYDHRRRLAIKETDRDHVLEYLADLDLGKYSLQESTEKLEGDERFIQVLRFVDNSSEYHFPTIEVDPWFHRHGLIETRHRNPFLSAIDEEFVNKTVHCVTPRYLGGDVEKDQSFTKAIDVQRPVIGIAEFPVDIVYTWVDDTDPKWQARLNKAKSADAVARNAQDVDASRYRNREELRFSLRSVASYFKCVQNIYIVTDAQTPYWLDTSHPQIHVVDHRDIFPDHKHLPTFNSHAIESQLYRIENLSEHFLYLNDDFLFVNPCRKLDFYFCNGIGKAFFEPLPNIYGQASDEFPGFKNGAMNGSRLLRERYGRTAHTYHLHTPFALKRSVMAKMWEEFGPELERTSAAQFRSSTDLSPVSFFYHYYAVLNKESVPSSIPEVYVNLSRRSAGTILDELRRDDDALVCCINDTTTQSSTHEAAKDRMVANFFADMYPVPASWELDR